MKRLAAMLLALVAAAAAEPTAIDAGHGTNAPYSVEAGTPGPLAVTPRAVTVDVVRRTPVIDALIGARPEIVELAEGFTFTEGPVWVPELDALLFSDPNENTIYKYAKDGQLSVFRTLSGYSGADIAEYKQPGSNGLALDPQGRLTINEHGNRRVTRLERDGRVTVLADRLYLCARDPLYRMRLNVGGRQASTLGSH